MKIIRMTPDEYAQDGKNLIIKYTIGATNFGKTLIASTSKGTCYVAFGEREETLPDLEAMFPKATFIEKSDEKHHAPIDCINSKGKSKNSIKLHIKGSDFQLSVWKALLEIPTGHLTSYQSIAHKINNPKAVRAVGTAIGSNPVSYLVPCHRIIRSDGQLGGYRWGLETKIAMIKAEAENIEK